MSHYTKVKTKIKKKSALVKALGDLGFTAEKLRVEETAKQLEGYEGRLRDQKAEIIIPRRYVGGAANDIGFKEQADGTYEAIISEYDSHRYNEPWLKKLNQRYARHNIVEELEEQGLFIESEKEENGEIFIEATTAF